MTAFTKLNLQNSLDYFISKFGIIYVEEEEKNTASKKNL
jgi:hypothetical protein